MMDQNVIINPVFWLNSSFIVYFSGNLFLFMYSNLLIGRGKHSMKWLWEINSVLNIINYLGISIGFWKAKQ